jgi:hypothetical protein
LNHKIIFEKNAKKMQKSYFFGENSHLRLFLLHFAKWLNKKSPHFAAGA